VALGSRHRLAMAGRPPRHTTDSPQWRCGPRTPAWGTARRPDRRWREPISHARLGRPDGGISLIRAAVRVMLAAHAGLPITPKPEPCPYRSAPGTNALAIGHYAACSVPSSTCAGPSIARTPWAGDPTSDRPAGAASPGQPLRLGSFAPGPGAMSVRQLRIWGRNQSARGGSPCSGSTALGLFGRRIHDAARVKRDLGPDRPLSAGPCRRGQAGPL
jgi:hypothetical protein